MGRIPADLKHCHRIDILVEYLSGSYLMELEVELATVGIIPADLKHCHRYDIPEEYLPGSYLMELGV